MGALASLSIAILVFQLVIGLVLIPKQTQEARRVASTGIAGQTQTVARALDGYVRSQFVSLLGTAGVGPIQVTIAQLQATPNLPAAFPVTNPYGQAYCMGIRRLPSGLVESLLVTTGGRAFTNDLDRDVAIRLNARGGFVDPATNRLTSSFGTYSLDTSVYPFCGPAAVGRIGHVAYYNPETLSGDSLKILATGLSKHGDLVNKPTCEGAATPRIKLGLAVSGTGAQSELFSAQVPIAIDLPGQWRIEFYVLTDAGYVTPAPAFHDINVDLYCQ